MSENLVKLFTTQFSTNLQLALQQMGSKLRDRVQVGSHTGKQASPVQELGAISTRRVTGRFAPMGRVDADYKRRWVFPVDDDLPQMMDSFDELRTIVDPKSQYVGNAANAFGRAFDDEIILAATRDSYIGTDAGSLTTEAFDTTNFRIADTFGASAATGLTVAKIIELRRKFRHAHVDLETDPITLCAGSQQESDLLNQVEVVSKEFQDRPVLQDGKVTRFLGCDIVYTERLPTYTTNTRGVLAFAKSGLYLGVWSDLSSRASIRNDLSGEPWQLYSKASYGATRLMQGKVIQVGCLDTTGADSPA